MMDGEKLFLLLDIDGVLLESRGYRLAYLDTVNDLLSRMGQPDLSIERTVADAFEVSGIPAEWDMVPLTIAAFVSWYIELSGDTPDSGAFPPLCGSVRLTDNAAFTEMLLARIEEYKGVLDPGLTVIDAVRTAFEGGRLPGLRFLADAPFAGRFFNETLDPVKSPLFANLMCRILGSEVFASFYGLTVPIECGSYLETKDIPLISDHYRTLLPEISGNGVYSVVMTYRPTRLPVWDGNNKALYYVNTPEGDCAMQLIGWTDGRIPMIGAGGISYIENKYGLRREFYVKPHPFHALASVMMALCGDELRALETAAALCASDPEKDPDPAAELLPKGSALRLAVFEDSVSGIMCVRNAARRLSEWGYSAEAVLCGIRTTPGKTNRLLYAGAKIYPDVNTALKAVIDR